MRLLEKKTVDLLRQCQKEVLEFPEEVRGELADIMARLEEGHKLSMPLSRPMSDVGQGCHELRFRHRTGIYRIFYVLAGGGRIYLLHAFKKKTKTTPRKNIELAIQRLKEVL